MLDFSWDKKAQRYRYASGAGKGQFVGAEAVKSLVGEAISKTQGNAQSVTEKLLNGKLTVGGWESEIAAQIKQVSIWQTMIGKGGQKQLDSRDYGRVGAEMRLQLSYLRKFSQEVLEGRLTANQIKARVNLYFERTTGLYEEARRSGHKENGYLWERRQLNSGGNECADCFSYAAMGWQAIGILPRPGNSCECRANCLCSFKFSDELPKPNN